MKHKKILSIFSVALLLVTSIGLIVFDSEDSDASEYNSNNHDDDGIIESITDKGALPGPITLYVGQSYKFEASGVYEIQALPNWMRSKTVTHREGTSTTISGMPTQPGTYDLVYKPRMSMGAGAAQTVKITVVDKEYVPSVIDRGALPGPITLYVGQSYKFEASGVYEMQALPNWMTSSSCSYVVPGGITGGTTHTSTTISGMPTQPGTYDLVYKPRMSMGAGAAQTVQITVVDKEYIPTLVDHGALPGYIVLYVGQAYQFTGNGISQVTSLPSWMTSSSCSYVVPEGLTGGTTNTSTTISGMPTQPGTYDLVYKPRMSMGAGAAQTVQITVVDKEYIPTLLDRGALPGPITLYVGQSYKFEASGVYEMQALPNWMTSSSCSYVVPGGITGGTTHTSTTISGMPTQPGTYDLVYKPRMSMGAGAAQTVKITVVDKEYVPSVIDRGALPGPITLKVGQSYQFTGNGISQVTSLPNWMTSSSCSYVVPGGLIGGTTHTSTTISGTPTQPGSYNISYKPTSSIGAGAEQTVQIIVSNIDYIQTIIDNGILPGPITIYVGQSYQFNGNGISQVTSLPNWMTSKTVTYKEGISTTISGVPALPGLYNISYKPTSAVGAGAEQSIQIIVQGDIRFTSARLADMMCGNVVNYIPQTNISAQLSLVQESTTANWLTYSNGVLSGTAPYNEEAIQYKATIKATAPYCLDVYLTLVFYVSPVLIIDLPTVYGLPERDISPQPVHSNIPCNWWSSDMPVGFSITSAGYVIGSHSTPGTYYATVHAETIVGIPQSISGILTIKIMDAHSIQLEYTTGSEILWPDYSYSGGLTFGQPLMLFAPPPLYNDFGVISYWTLEMNLVSGPSWVHIEEKPEYGKHIYAVVGNAPFQESTHRIEVEIVSQIYTEIVSKNVTVDLEIIPPIASTIEFTETIASGELYEYAIQTPLFLSSAIFGELPLGIELSYGRPDTADLLIISGIPSIPGVYVFEWRIVTQGHDLTINYTMNVQ